MIGLVETASAAVARATRALAVVLAAVMVGCLLLQIFFRYALASPLTWTEELALLTFAWIVMLMGSLGVREAFHVRLTFLVDRFSAALRRRLEQAILVLIGAFGALLASAGYAYVEGTRGMISAAIGYPIEALHLAAPVCGVLIVLHAAARLLAGAAAP